MMCSWTPSKPVDCLRRPHSDSFPLNGGTPTGTAKQADAVGRAGTAARGGGRARRGGGGVCWRRPCDGGPPQQQQGTGPPGRGRGTWVVHTRVVWHLGLSEYTRLSRTDGVHPNPPHPPTYLI